MYRSWLVFFFLLLLLLSSFPSFYIVHRMKQIESGAHRIDFFPCYLRFIRCPFEPSCCRILWLMICFDMSCCEIALSIIGAETMAINCNRFLSFMFATMIVIIPYFPRQRQIHQIIAQFSSALCVTYVC